MRPFLTMWWMLFWRFYLIFLFLKIVNPLAYGQFDKAFSLSLIASFGILLATKKYLRPFPLIKLLRKKEFLLAKDDARENSLLPPLPSLPELLPLDKASRPGRMTGLEPRHLKDISYNRPWFMWGNPGVGLASSSFSADAIAAGQAGEANFAKALAKEGLLDKYPSFWSVGLPGEDGTGFSDWDTDVDCIIAANWRIFLIDIKNYKQGAVTYENYGDQLVCRDHETSRLVGAPRAMSRNMEMAYDRFSKRFAGTYFKVVPVVVMMPTGMGMGLIDNVRWPGNVEAIDLSSMIEVLKQDSLVVLGPDDMHVLQTQLFPLMKS